MALVYFEKALDRHLVKSIINVNPVMSDAENQGYLIALRGNDTGMKIDNWADRLGDFGCEMAIWARMR